MRGRKGAPWFTAGSQRRPRPALSRYLQATLRGPQASRGQGLGAERGREGPGKTTQIALQWERPPGRAGFPEPPPLRAFSVRCSQVLCPAWAGRCRSRCVAPVGCTRTRAARSEVQRRVTTVSEKVVRKFREVLLRPSFQAFGVRINHLYSAFRELRT